jgi:hypothetical protein
MTITTVTIQVHVLRLELAAERATAVVHSVAVVLQWCFSGVTGVTEGYRCGIVYIIVPPFCHHCNTIVTPL